MINFELQIFIQALLTLSKGESIKASFTIMGVKFVLSFDSQSNNIPKEYADGQYALSNGESFSTLFCDDSIYKVRQKQTVSDCSGTTIGQVVTHIDIEKCDTEKEK